jgi:hypothetical protein
MSSLTAIFTALQNGVQAINSLSQTLSQVFPGATAVSTSATVGTLTFSSSQPAGFMTVISSSGGTYKIPIYNN